MAFLTEPEPPRGVAQSVAPGVRRLVAPNPSPMTYHGTNTYLIDTPDGLVVLDPGPADAGHVDSILAVAGQRIALILVSHTHRDHVGAVPALKQATGAIAAGFHASQSPNFTPDRPLHDGDVIAGLTVLSMPGHASDQVCFLRPDRIVFSADHVMGWATTVVSPPGGDMVAYCRSLGRLLDLTRPGDIFLPGHGPAITEPTSHMQNLLQRRRARETTIVRALSERPNAIGDLVLQLYARIDPSLHPAAARNVEAHLIKLEADGTARRDGDMWVLA